MERATYWAARSFRVLLWTRRRAGQPNLFATGDDLNGSTPDDEDGVAGEQVATNQVLTGIEDEVVFTAGGGRPGIHLGAVPSQRGRELDADRLCRRRRG